MSLEMLAEEPRRDAALAAHLITWLIFKLLEHSSAAPNQLTGRELKLGMDGRAKKTGSWNTNVVRANSTEFEHLGFCKL